jgi:hypothetical protein
MSLVYFDNRVDEFVFIGNLYPALGTYEIGVHAVIKQATGYVVSSFTFELAVMDELPQESTEEEHAAAEPICL